MKTKNLGIIASIVVGITIIGAIVISGQETSQISNTLLDKYAIDSPTVLSELQSNSPVLVVDIRAEEEFRQGHIDGSSHDVYDEKTLEKRVNTIKNRLPEVAESFHLVLVDENDSYSKVAAQTISNMGIDAYYLEGGIQSWNRELVSTEIKTTISSDTLATKIEQNDDIYLLDVREPDELLKTKIDGSVNIPLAEIFQLNRISEIPTDKTVVVICGSGNRATIATYVLAQEGIEFQVLEDGIKGWTQYLEDSNL